MSADADGGGARPPAPRPALTAASMIEAYGFDLDLAASIVLVLDAALVPDRAARRQRRSRQIGNRHPLRHPFRQVGSVGDGVDIVLAAGPGAAVAAITVEFLAAFGVERFIAVGTAGLLRPMPDSTGIGPLIIGRAESDEGTSAHYGGDLAADPRLTTALVAALGGEPRVALTTDVPFRHTPERLGSHRRRADVVEMECAALFAAANHLAVRAAAVLVPSDRFDADGWRPNDHRSTMPLLRNAVEVATRVLADS